MAIDTEIDDGSQELAFGADDSGVVVFDTESADGDHEGIRIHTKSGACELARLLLLWAGPGEGAPRFVEGIAPEKLGRE